MCILGKWDRSDVTQEDDQHGEEEDSKVEEEDEFIDTEDEVDGSKVETDSNESIGLYQEEVTEDIFMSAPVQMGTQETNCVPVSDPEWYLIDCKEKKKTV